MVEEQLVPGGITDQRVLQVMGEVPRHLFVDDAMQSSAYGNYPLPIGGGQTISQPFIVALMTEMLELQGAEKVLEIGTGSGYQAAVLSRLCEKVYTIERIEGLLSGARKVFDRLRYYNIVAKLDDGTMGWSEYGPYDAIVLTAAGPKVPVPLLDQLADGGRMVLPVGSQEGQELQIFHKEGEDIRMVAGASVRFVDLIGKHGWPLK
ncbi:unnamed protein product [Cyprideis torosa]|uniref:protein-L-isoaspartate(D-aspartate) O-methyltransferase n=1 Tax=Cyprideis torosa TaxID=163714 RepID=A0A7R8WEG2_9CRUS|nr:unnamed protein product [Cyprideis torosa]CAG0889448.1 unnamed protein product [Cyprideis torosa]